MCHAHKSKELIAVINLINDTHDLQQTTSLQSLQQQSATSSDCQVTLSLQTPLQGVGLLFRISSPLNYNSVNVYHCSCYQDSYRPYKKCRQRTIILYRYFHNSIPNFASLTRILSRLFSSKVFFVLLFHFLKISSLVVPFLPVLLPAFAYVQPILFPFDFHYQFHAVPFCSKALGWRLLLANLCLEHFSKKRF